jgi:hypothetical protein
MGKQEGQINGTCVCERTTYAFVPGAEALNLELDHTYLLPQQVHTRKVPKWPCCVRSRRLKVVHLC